MSCTFHPTNLDIVDVLRFDFHDVPAFIELQWLHVAPPALAWSPCLETNKFVKLKSIAIFQLHLFKMIQSDLYLKGQRQTANSHFFVTYGYIIAVH